MARATEALDSACHSTGAPLGYELCLRRVLDGTPEQIWTAWTRPELLKQWWAPRPFETREASIDLRVGGAFRTVMRAPDGAEFPTASVFLEITPNRRLVFTDGLTTDWRPAGEPFMVASVEITPVAEGKTEYVATARHWKAASMKHHEDMGFHEGWGKCADQLAELLKRI